MVGEKRCVRWLIAAAIVATADSVSAPVQAQFPWDQQYQTQRPRQQSSDFFNWFGGGGNNSRPDYYQRRDDRYYGPPQRQYHQPTESSRAPPPRKTESRGDQKAPTTSVIVLGDDMADWLAYGLEDVFSDSPEIRVVRKNKLASGLLRYDTKGDLDWWHVARDTLAQQKADYVVMMLGLSDRQELREKDIAKEAEIRTKDQDKDQPKDQQAKDRRAKDETDQKNGQQSVKPDDSAETATPAPRGKRTGGPAEFRSAEWKKIYTRRIDDTIAALKSKGVPVIWVGLPSIRGSRSTADAAYLNELYRTRAERAGIAYVDVWDGFVDESGKYSNYGPDYEGQARRLRLSDGVFFTKAGAIKLARYVEHELSRYMSDRVPVALPIGPIEAAPANVKPAERPLMGPVVPLTGKLATTPKDSDELLGAPGSSSIHGDTLATKVLAKDEPIDAPPGRADNFAWPAGVQSANAVPAAVLPPGPESASGAATNALALAPAKMKQDERKRGATGKLTQKTTKKRLQPEGTKSKSHDDVLRPPMLIGPSSGVFNRMR